MTFLEMEKVKGQNPPTFIVFSNEVGVLMFTPFSLCQGPHSSGNKAKYVGRYQITDPESLKAAMEAATTCALALQADELICFVDDPILDENESLIRYMTLHEADQLVQSELSRVKLLQNTYKLLRGLLVINLNILA